jgi:hypothetical protein
VLCCGLQEIKITGADIFVNPFKEMEEEEQSKEAAAAKKVRGLTHCCYHWTWHWTWHAHCHCWLSLRSLLVREWYDAVGVNKRQDCRGQGQTSAVDSAGWMHTCGFVSSH